MKKKLFTIWLTLFFVLLASGAVFGQIEPPPPFGRPAHKEELPKSVKETLAKHRIEKEKKEYEELLKRSEEAARLSEELEQSFTSANRLSAEDEKKIERLEKLIKKIRNDLGADDDDENDAENKPASMFNALKQLQSNAAKLFEEIKKSTRYSVSAAAIQSSNMLLKVLKFIRVRD